MSVLTERHVTPSILAADFADLAAQVREIMDAGCRVIHCDVMDGHFVPPITFGPMVVSALRESLPDDAYLDVHLMIERPERHVAEFAKAGADGITIHAESTPNIAFTLSAIRELGLNAGLVVSPGTPPDYFGENEIDLALIMTVNPGWGGQPFLHQPARQDQARARDARRRDADRGRRRRQPGDGGPMRRGRRDVVRRGLGDLRRRRPRGGVPRDRGGGGLLTNRARASATFGSVRAIRRALLLAFALLLAAAPAAMAGPGITFYPKAGPVLELSGGQIAQLADLPATDLHPAARRRRAGKKVTLRGLSIATLVARSGQGAQRVQVVKRNGGSTLVTPANFGTAMLSDDGTTTRYIRSSGGVVVDYIESSDIRLEVSVDGGDLVVKAKASRRR